MFGKCENERCGREHQQRYRGEIEGVPKKLCAECWRKWQKGVKAAEDELERLKALKGV